jgi:AmiR/NasT family two-component response regulator
LAALTRVEVYQAAGMLIAQLGVTAAEALVRLRGYAFAHDMTASEVAWEIIERRLRLADDAAHGPAAEDGRAG